MPERAEIPSVADIVSSVEGNEFATQNEQLGRAIRTAMGLGALAMLPNLIEDLRMSRNLDGQLKFVMAALKEGGFGTKDNKLDHLPIFHFNFVAAGGVEVKEVQVVEAEEAKVIEKIDPPLEALAWAEFNKDVSAPDVDEPKVQDVFDLIDLAGSPT